MNANKNKNVDILFLSVFAMALTVISAFPTTIASAQETFELRGRVIDSESRKMIHSRVYLQDEKGNYLTVVTASPEGNAIPYKVDRGGSKEIHTTLSNHVFKANLAPGKYRITAEHGKEYLSKTVEVTISDRAVQQTIALKRWSNVAADHWYSGEVHIHRKVEEMPTVMLAEDLNVTLPLTYWVTDTESLPSSHNKAVDTPYTAKLIEVTKNHVIWPINTEYEIFSVKKKRHTLGAFFILGHKNPLSLKTPPVAPVLTQARKEGALIDLDKHNWPWSMMIVPQMKVDLFELTNNHIWRTQFLFKDWYKNYAADYMKLELDKDGFFTPKGWLDFGLQNYYALLNCGIRISPSGGTASGVHPVPAGFGRVYVHLPNGFSYQAWMKGLKKGNSFVTNGPMLLVDIDGKIAGHSFDLTKKKKFKLNLSANYPTSGDVQCQIIVNGKVYRSESSKATPGNHSVQLKADLEITDSSWLCVRCFQKQPNGNISFAHSAPFYFKNGDQPVTPRKVEVEYLIKRVADEIERNKEVLNENQLQEFQSALEFYRNKLKIAE